MVVADDRNNRCLFTPQTKKIGYNPDFIIRIKSDYVVMGKLSSILPILENKKIRRSFPSTNDFVREDIHAAGFFMPVIAANSRRSPVAIFIIVLSIVYLISELARLDGKKHTNYLSSHSSCRFAVRALRVRRCPIILCLRNPVDAADFSVSGKRRCNRHLRFRRQYGLDFWRLNR